MEIALANREKSWLFSDRASAGDGRVQHCPPPRVWLLGPWSKRDPGTDLDMIRVRISAWSGYGSRR